MADDGPARDAGRSAAAWGRISLRRRLLLGVATALLSCSYLPAANAADVPAPTDKRPIVITADSGIEWQKEARLYIARGDAVATRGATQVRADTLVAHYRPAKGAEGGTEVYRLDAEGHVVISKGADTVVGDHAVYDVGQEIAVITGKGLRLTTPKDVVTARDSFEWYDQQQIAVARGDAVAVSGDRRIRADVLTARMIKDKPSDAAKPRSAPAAPPAGGTASAHGPPATELENSRISRIDAQGNVIVSTPTDIGRGNYGVYDAIKGIVTLLGNVTITRGQNVIHGEYAVVDLKTNVSRMMTLAAAPGKPPSRVEGIFVRQDTAAKPSGPHAARQYSPAPAARP
jgi:lipopolysaccharide export system protein LptA